MCSGNDDRFSSSAALGKLFCILRTRPASTAKDAELFSCVHSFAFMLKLLNFQAKGSNQEMGSPVVLLQLSSL